MIEYGIVRLNTLLHGRLQGLLDQSSSDNNPGHRERFNWDRVVTEIRVLPDTRSSEIQWLLLWNYSTDIRHISVCFALYIMTTNHQYVSFVQDIVNSKKPRCQQGFDRCWYRVLMRNKAFSLSSCAVTEQDWPNLPEPVKCSKPR